MKTATTGERNHQEKKENIMRIWMTAMRRRNMKGSLHMEMNSIKTRTRIGNKGEKGLIKVKRNMKVLKKRGNTEGKQMRGMMKTTIINLMRRYIMLNDITMINQGKIGMKKEQRENFRKEKMTKSL